MRTFVGFCAALIFTCALSAQYRSGQAGLVGGVSAPLFKSGVPPTIPGAAYQVGNAVNPGGTGLRLVTPGARRVVNPTAVGAVGIPYAVPVYAGGYGNSYDDGSQPAATPAQQQPNVVVVYPPQPAPPMGNQYGPNGPAAARRGDPEPMSNYQPPAGQQDDDPSPEHYLIAFKDHTIYSAVAFWVDGDTIHYFTAGNKHNQASVSLIDVALTERLNKDSGINLKLPSQGGNAVSQQ
jgi:hypothetical protein